MPDDRPYDIVLFGATGFTGALTAEYLARTAGPGLRWALAGRNRAKLAGVRDRIGLPGLPLLHADAADPASLAEIARQARVVATTVGPFVAHGEPLVAACADAGTHYADITGEPEFVDRMFVKYHDRARRRGAKLVHACGFDSVPHDLGAYFTVKHLPEGVPLEVSGFVRVSGAPSGGTVHSAVSAVSRFRRTAEAARVRHAVEERPKGRRVRGLPGRVRYVGGWALPLPTLDPQIVARSAAALERYGPDFTYRHHVAVRHLAGALGLVAGAGALTALAHVPAARSLLLSRFAPGGGPDAERRARSWFKVTFLGVGGGERVVTEVTGGDPGYGETAKMLGESALSLATDDLPAVFGQVTTAVAMGEALIGRLRRAGITFTVLEDSRT
ncbi:saccharopine dehydrogenase (NAD+, L-glutamate forming) [Streptosporangium becharense]|uniref:Saccharopine dehydrogenase (NAD+, L-glutamate forming) n=1 Tax=Streptosporangium becharense TaxID=1816182 RepID=A0A7W9IBK2_9ACTN|nr:saccharopine dehydrogenase NADP-binding domain-containing protein [Streptosporangium becharense]MBB2913636.1 saccharopine dehydrogenase (NAD+, L-glutamate forming) [Streptosporangium becharense]MBB5817717.1 saccharopine dehydrogenase (NAD+, L-glutamate forming) [Streptosporangium becharense]